MRILNVSSILPLQSIHDENDIVIKTQIKYDECYKSKSEFITSIPYSSRLFSKIKKKWSVYRSYRFKKIKIKGYEIKTYAYPWIKPPVGGLKYQILFLPINLLIFRFYNLKKINNNISKPDLVVCQNLMPDAFVGYYIAKKYNSKLIINLRPLLNPIPVQPTG